MMRNDLFVLTFIFSNLLILSNVYSRPTSLKLEKQEDNNSDGFWYFLDINQDKTPGISVSKIKEYNLKFQQKPVIIAVIDTGIDVNHDQIKPFIWINKNEIPNNYIDDDLNGFTDDVIGWNFLGSSQALSKVSIYNDQLIHLEHLNESYHIQTDSYAITRRLQYLENLTERTQTQQEKLQELEKLIYQKHTIAKSNLKAIELEINDYVHALRVFDLSTEDELPLQELNQFIITNDLEREAKNLLFQYLSEKRSYQDLLEFKAHFSKEFYYFYNKELDERARVIQDNPKLLQEKGYGNNDVIGPIALHGTSVAGIVSLVASELNLPVKIMPIKAISEGDERDKDIINAIYYAVDNGAKIINMSFGKNDSLYPGEVFKALKYAEKKGVLIIRAAGNEFQNLDRHPYYPLKSFKESELTNMITIGSHNGIIDVNFFSSFSNFGKKSVDFIAPGYLMSSLALDNEVALYSGTSLSAPLVSTAAAFILCLDENLSPAAQTQIIKNSLNDYSNLKVFKAGAGFTKLNNLVKKAGSPNLESILETILKTSSN